MKIFIIKNKTGQTFFFLISRFCYRPVFLLKSLNQRNRDILRDEVMFAHKIIYWPSIWPLFFALAPRNVLHFKLNSIKFDMYEDRWTSWWKAKKGESERKKRACSRWEYNGYLGIVGTESAGWLCLCLFRFDVWSIKRWITRLLLAQINWLNVSDTDD